MKITRRDLGVIMILVGILSVFLVYQMSFKDMQTQVEALQAEQVTLKEQIAALDPVKENAPFYQSEIERFSTEISDMIKEFPVNILYEDGIMYVVELEKNLGVEIPSFNVTEAVVSNTVEGTGALTGSTYTLGTSNLNFSYTVGSYEDVKGFVDYVYSDEENKRSVTSISLVQNSETGEITGSININMYVMTDGLTPYEEQDLPNDSMGVENIFGEVEETDESEEE